MRDVQPLVSQRDWGIFQSLSLTDMSGKAVATQFDVKIGTAYVIRGRVRKLLEERLLALDEGSAENA